MTRYQLIHQDLNLDVPVGEITIGRSAQCDLVLDDPSVSRVHAAVVREDDIIYVEDRGSRNGVIVNLAHIGKRAELKDGDSITVGHQTIRVVTVSKTQDANRTVQIQRGSDTTESTNPSVIEQQPIILMAGLATKAIRVNRLDEAERILPNLLSIAQKKSKSAERLTHAEFNAIVELIVGLVEASQQPEHLSRLFGFHLALQQLMNRDLVIRLYNLVRDVGYRTCPQLKRYLTKMASQEHRFDAAEKFILRRLEGLAKLCG